MTMAYSVAPWPSSRLSVGEELAQLERNPLEHLPTSLSNSQAGTEPALLRHSSIEARGSVALRTAKGWVEPPIRVSFARRARDNAPVAEHMELTRDRRAARLPRARRDVLRVALPRADG